MKKLFLLIMIATMLVGCGSKEMENVSHDTNVERETLKEDILKEEDELLKGIENYSKRYIEESFEGSIADEWCSRREWEDLEKAGYYDYQIEYILMVRYGDIE